MSTAVATVPAANAFSAQMGLATTHLWRPQHGVGHQPYVVVGTTWLAAGAPLAPPAQQVALIEAFVAAAAHAGCHAAYFGLSQALAEAAKLRWLPCGQEPLWAVARWDDPKTRLRCFRQTRRARRAGVEVAPLLPPTHAVLLPAVAAQLQQLLQRWQAGQNLPPLRFLAEASLRDDAPDALRWIAWCRGRPVGVAVALPPAGEGPWLVEQLIRAPDAPNGTVELLVDQAMRSIALRAETAWVSLGVVALAGDVPWPLRWARALGRDLYPFAGLSAFRRKLGPEATLALGLAFTPQQGTVSAIYALLTAFAGKPLWRYAWHLLGQGSMPMVWAIAACLPPWTVALAMLPPQWFASPLVQRLWLVFDAFLAVALLRLAVRPTLRLAQILAWIVTLDVVLTAAEGNFASSEVGGIGTSDLPGLRWALRGVAILAPALAARVLWGLVARLRRRRPTGQASSARATSTACLLLFLLPPPSLRLLQQASLPL